MKKNNKTVVALNEAEANQAQVRYELQLYVVGTTPNSMKAIVNIRKFCQEYLHGRYELKIIDIARHPRLALGEQIIAAPTLVKKLPLPLRRFIGDMSRTDSHLVGLGLHKALRAH